MFRVQSSPLPFCCKHAIFVCLSFLCSDFLGNWPTRLHPSSRILVDMASDHKRQMPETAGGRSALLPATLIMILTAFGAMLYMSTHVYLMEQSVCREYYKLHDPARVGKNGLMDETICKLPQIQSQVVEILGVYKVLTYLPAFFMAGIYGKLARTIGKKPIMIVSMTSYTLGGVMFTIICYYHEKFDVRWIYLTPFFDLIGGGCIVVASFSYTYISESIDKKRLSAYYYKLSAGQMAAQFAALCLCAILLRRHVYVQCVLGAVSLSATVPLCFMLPSKEESSFQQRSETSPLLCAAPTLTPLTIDDDEGPLFWTIMRSLRTNARHSISQIEEIMSSSALSRTTMFTFFMITVGISIKLVFVQWTSVTYGWILAEVHAILSFEMIISTIILLTLPTVSHTILKPRFGGSVTEVDLFVAKISAGLHVVGIICLGFAPDKVSYILAMTVWKLGNGLVDAVRSYVTGMLESKEEVEQLYLGMGMVEMFAGVVATAAWSGLFARVLGQGYFVSRLPFMASSVILLASCVCIWLLGRPGLKKPKSAEEF